MMYGTMWSLGIQFDTRFFAVAACMLGYMRLSIVDFFTYAIRYLVYYIAAKRRIEVRRKICDIPNIIFCINRHFFVLMSLNEMIDYSQHLR
jgi:hypothetical protein